MSHSSLYRLDRSRWSVERVVFLIAGIIARSEWPDAYLNWMLGNFVGVITLVPILLVKPAILWRRTT